VCFLQLEGKNLYLIGEEHNTNGTFQNDLDKHVVEQIRSYIQRTKEKITVFSEFTFLQMRERFTYFAALPSASTQYYGYSPNGTYGYYYWNNLFSREHTQTIISDSRKTAPYDIYTMIIDPSVYCFEHFIQDYDKMLPIVRKWAKQAEKAIVKNIRTRSSAKAFLESLYMPDKDFPDWYKAMTNNELSDQLRQKMKHLREVQPDMYHKVVEHMSSYYYGRWAKTPYTAALNKIQAVRRTTNSRMVGSVNPASKRLFIELTSYLLDLTVILEFLLSTEKNTFVFAGLEHIGAIVNFFADKTIIYSKMNKNGNIPSGEALNGVPNLANQMPSILNNIIHSETLSC
jgi:hypothetical protein